MTQKELEIKLGALGDINEEQKKSVVCSLVGHSNIITNCFGYIHCSRCEAQIGDLLGGCYSNDSAVIVGHNCPTCRENYERLGWEDKFMVPNPFNEESEASNE